MTPNKTSGSSSARLTAFQAATVVTPDDENRSLMSLAQPSEVLPAACQSVGYISDDSVDEGGPVWLSTPVGKKNHAVGQREEQLTAPMLVVPEWPSTPNSKKTLSIVVQNRPFLSPEAVACQQKLA